jgi:hypothetical protein
MRLEPIPNPAIVGGGDDQIHLGIESSMAVTPQPTIGWIPW